MNYTWHIGTDSIFGAIESSLTKADKVSWADFASRYSSGLYTSGCGDSYKLRQLGVCMPVESWISAVLAEPSLIDQRLLLAVDTAPGYAPGTYAHFDHVDTLFVLEPVDNTPISFDI